MNSEQKNTFYMKDVLVYIPQDQLTAAFPIEGNKAMWPKDCFNPIKCVQGMIKKLKIQTKVPMINFIDQNLLHKNGIGYNYIYYRNDNKVVMTYDASIILSYITQYDFKPQILDKSSQIKSHLKMIDWSLNNQLKQQEQELKQQEQMLKQQQIQQRLQLQQTQQLQSQQDLAFTVTHTTTTRRASTKSKQAPQMQTQPIAVSEDLQLALQDQQQVSQEQETNQNDECDQKLLDNLAQCVQTQQLDMDDNLTFDAL